jgi:hypothetical protein
MEAALSFHLISPHANQHGGDLGLGCEYYQPCQQEKPSPSQTTMALVE